MKMTVVQAATALLSAQNFNIPETVSFAFVTTTPPISCPDAPASIASTPSDKKFIYLFNCFLDMRFFIQQLKYPLRMLQ